MTAQEVAALLRVSPPTVYRYGQDGTLDPVRVAGIVRFRRADVLALLDPVEPTA